jgi:hypothetical protein
MNKWTELLGGLILLIGAILIAWLSSINSWTLFGKDFNFLSSAWIVLKGGLFWFVALIGLLMIVLGISDLKN